MRLEQMSEPFGHRLVKMLHHLVPGAGKGGRSTSGTEAVVDERLWSEVVAFLRESLPAQAIRIYREMITADPDAWHRDPHFGGGIVVRHLLRGNGIDEAVLGVDDLERIWPELLRDAVLNEHGPPEQVHPEAREQPG
jgi:hypothetical protein